MKKYLKLIISFLILFCILLPYSYAANKDKTVSRKTLITNNIGQMKKNINQKLNIISKNNREVQKLQNDIRLTKKDVMHKVSNLRKDKNVTAEELLSIKNKVEILKNYNANLSLSRGNIEKASKNITNAKLTKNFYGITSQYDLIIEKQNEKIISLKNIIKNIDEIK